MLEQMQTDIIGRHVWLFYNAIGAVAQCPYNWGVGSAFHPMKIHIFIDLINERSGMTRSTWGKVHLWIYLF